MKRFRFTLHAVEVLRQQQERKALEQYAADLEAEREAQSQLQSIQAKIEEAWSQLKILRANDPTIAQLLNLQAYCASAEESRKKAFTLFEQARSKAGQSCQKFLEARQKRETVDRFHQDQKERHGRAAALAEQNALDELALRNRAPGADRYGHGTHTQFQAP